VKFTSGIMAISPHMIALPLKMMVTMCHVDKHDVADKELYEQKVSCNLFRPYLQATRRPAAVRFACTTLPRRTLTRQGLVDCALATSYNAA
jgi:hypothetical protein